MEGYRHAVMALLRIGLPTAPSTLQVLPAQIVFFVEVSSLKTLTVTISCHANADEHV